jgi:hypothetical protein
VFAWSVTFPLVAAACVSAVFACPPVSPACVVSPPASVLPLPFRQRSQSTSETSVLLLWSLSALAAASWSVVLSLLAD